MRSLLDAVNHRITQVQIVRGHVDFGPQGAFAFGKLAPSHACEQIQIFFLGALPERTVPARRGQATAIFPDLVCVQVADIGISISNQGAGKFIKLSEVVGSEIGPLSPVVSQPTYILHDGIDVLRFLLLGVSVVEAKITEAAEFLRYAKIKGDGFGMTDMQVATRFRGNRVWTRGLLFPAAQYSTTVSRIKSVATGPEWFLSWLFRSRAIGSILGLLSVEPPVSVHH